MRLGGQAPFLVANRCPEEAGRPKAAIQVLLEHLDALRVFLLLA